MEGPTHERTYLLHSYEVDVRGRARPGVLFAFLLDSAWSHVRSSAFDFDSLEEQGRFWVVSKFYAHFGRIPRWDESITVKTWGSGTDRLYALRDFVVRSEAGEKVAEATSAWLILDRGTLRPQKVDVLRGLFPFANPEAALSRPFEKLRAPSAGLPQTRYAVRFTDQDVNRHVNAARYLEWILDSLDGEMLSQRDLHSMEINFLAEGRLGDEIAVTVEPVGATHVCSITRLQDGKELCRALLSWAE
jgi:medium-chain acyl-[acyl-carrier-protein] hydrolase